MPLQIGYHVCCVVSTKFVFIDFFILITKLNSMPQSHHQAPSTSVTFYFVPSTVEGFDFVCMLMIKERNVVSFRASLVLAAIVTPKVVRISNLSYFERFL